MADYLLTGQGKANIIPKSSGCTKPNLPSLSVCLFDLGHLSLFNNPKCNGNQLTDSMSTMTRITSISLAGAIDVFDYVCVCVRAEGISSASLTETMAPHTRAIISLRSAGWSGVRVTGWEG
jgi:hypothetical protein